jgi:hypothetical protein
MGGVFSFTTPNQLVIEDEHKPCEFQVFRHYADKIIDEQKVEILNLRHMLSEKTQENIALKRRLKRFS